ncbi:hypothetical protein [Xanthomonas arboricola]|uniref:Uncharacterized protein n=2 Tax=Xanthomonas arboricola pv. pruni TaxID=69929 RepID=A0AAQ0W8E8_9XANT|nr:hypothetical protein [Xanthomonas arboricola]KCW98602.1 hypothetical protein DK27_07285 [Xanthomonas arboricola pv. pruni]KPN10180.1 hypothetical protein AN652_12605 [Xanthomonas arboricola pv. pruni]MDN0267923.1 hypothetical protein [Xanthomonas arboricola pv. pruni]MDN0272724.1 hypothetical protein [Xanthomonas arboricola pv. pruni]MDN0276308.1 hypothetical protein [Xanthomonas arboricola pv. pruni]
MSPVLTLSRTVRPASWQWRRTGYAAPDDCRFIGRQALLRYANEAFRAALAAVEPDDGSPFIDEIGEPWADAEVFYTALLEHLATRIQEHARGKGHQYIGVQECVR